MDGSYDLADWDSALGWEWLGNDLADWGSALGLDGSCDLADWGSALGECG